MRCRNPAFGSPKGWPVSGGRGRRRAQTGNALPESGFRVQGMAGFAKPREAQGIAGGVSGFVSTDLNVSLSCPCAVEEIASSEHGIGTEALADLQHGALDPAFLFQRFIVGKQVELVYAGIFRDSDRVDPEAAVKEAVARFAVELFQQSGPDQGYAV